MNRSPAAPQESTALAMLERLKKRPAEWIVPVAAGLLMGLLIVKFSSLAALGLMGLGVLLWMVNRWPVTGLLLLLAGTCFIPFRHLMPGFPQSLHLPDLLLYLLCLILLVRLGRRDGAFIQTTLTGPVLLFCLAGLLALGWGWYHYGSNFFGGVKECKVVLYYLVAILVPNLVRDEKNLRRLVMGSLAISTMVTVNLAVRGFAAAASAAESSDLFYALEQFAGGSGNILVYWSLCCALCLLGIRGVRISYLLLALLGLTYFAFMFHRHMYIGIAFAFLAFTASLLTFRQSAIKILLGMGLVVLLATVAVVWGPAPLRQYADLTGKRIASLGEIAGSHTVINRKLEDKYALDAIGQSPFLGMGYARSYRPAIYGLQDHLDWFIHNGYLWILIKMGLLGFLPFVWFYARAVGRGFAGWKAIPSDFFKSIALGTTIALLGMALVNMSVAYFMQDWGVLVFGLMLGLNETIFRLNPSS